MIEHIKFWIAQAMADLLIFVGLILLFVLVVFVAALWDSIRKLLRARRNRFTGESPRRSS